MILKIDGRKITAKDLEEIAKFLSAQFSDRDDFIVQLILEQPVEGTTMQDCEEFFNRFFKGKPQFVTKITIGDTNKKLGREEDAWEN
jgi:hypothetical protein